MSATPARRAGDNPRRPADAPDRPLQVVIAEDSALLREGLASLIATPFAAAVAVLRHDLYDVDKALALAVAWGLVTTLALLVVLGAVVYGLAIFALLGPGWLNGLLRDVTTAADTPAPPDLEQSDPTDDSAQLPDNEPPPRV